MSLGYKHLPLLTLLAASLSSCGSSDEPQTETADASKDSDSKTPSDDDDTDSDTGTSTDDTPTSTDTDSPGPSKLECPESIKAGTEAAIKLEPAPSDDAYTWSLSKPKGSTVFLQEKSPSLMALVPDVPGSYEIRAEPQSSSSMEPLSCTVQVHTELPEIKLKFSIPSGEAAGRTPFTFGHPFGVGELAAGQHLALQIAGQSEPVTLQMNVKALHEDGSVRHAIFSGIFEEIAAAKTLEAKLVPVANPEAEGPLAQSKLLSDTEDLTINIAMNGEVFGVSLHDLLKAQDEKLWLDGSIAREWRVAAPFKDEGGNEHPFLYGVFNVRAYGDAEFVFVDAVVEHNWTYQENPTNLLYDVSVYAGGKEVFAQASLNHLYRARWKKKFWLKQAPQLHIAHDPHYLMHTRAVPNYDPALVHNIDSKLLERYKTRWVPTIKTESHLANGDSAAVGEGDFEYSYDQYGLMGVGLAESKMGATGGRPDIGPNPRWVTSHLLNQDPVSRMVSLGMADLSGSWPMHFRDKKTGNILSIDDFPYASVLWNQSTTFNPVTEQREGPAMCEDEDKTKCVNPNRPDAAHQPAFAFVPYLITGDYYYLEELQFWANYNFLTMNPSYRSTSKGLLNSQQDRGQAWSLRTLGQVTYITPDDDPLKAYFADKLQHNLDDYHERYVNNPPNQYGALKPNYSFPTASPWMDDFFTWSVGYLTELGFDKAEPLYKWKSMFPVQRMGFGSKEAESYCWVWGSAYHLLIASEKGEPMYQTIDEVYRMSNKQNQPELGKFDDLGLECGSQEQADAAELKLGEMSGWGQTPAGFPSNMRPALAVAADTGNPGSKEAWKKFIERAVKPDYRDYPVWALVPRHGGQ